MAGLQVCAQSMTVSRGAVTVTVEPYANNVVRVSISTLKDHAAAAAGYGISAKSIATGWTTESTATGDVLRSSRLAVMAARPSPSRPPSTPSHSFVRAGSILPMGAPVESTNERQPLMELRVYSGADATFDLYNDDGTTYAYENGATQITHLHWSRSAQKLTHTGASLSGPPDATLVKVVHAP